MDTPLKDPAQIATETQRGIAHKKKFDPFEGIQQVAYPRHLVEAIDQLIEYKRDRGVPNYVDGEVAWDVVIKTFDIWATLYPQEYKDFFESQKAKWANMYNEHGSAKDKGGAQIRKIMEVPQILHQMISIMFPDQKWSVEFMHNLVKRLPLLKGYKVK